MAASVALALAGGLPARADGLNAIGTAGGLTIPTARTLGNGTVALGLGNAREPQIPGKHSRNVSYLLGVGLLPGFDIVGRFAENLTRDPSGYGLDGISDLSANVKFGFPLSQDKDALRLGAGMNDITGGALNFSAKYLVATKPFGSWELTLGYGRSDAVAKPGTHRALDGPFGGARYRLLDDARWGQVQLMAEHDARQPSLGANWTSAPIDRLARLQVHAGVHRSFERDAMPAATAVRFSLNFPLGENEDRLVTHPAPPQVAATPPSAAQDAPSARLTRLKDELIALGLEKLRVGRLGDGSWVIEYQNYRFSHHELDAMGVVVGKAAQVAPPEVRDIVVRALKTGQPVLTLRTRAAAWREFLKGGSTEAVQAVTAAQRGDGLARMAVDWVSEEPSSGSWAQIQLMPRAGYSMGTEYGAFDYSLALRMEAAIPLWKGAQIIVNAQRRVVESERAATYGGFFAELRPPEGLRALALHQSLWWGEYALFGVAVGRFENGAYGAESETNLFVPGRDDVIRIRGRLLELLPQMPLGADAQQWVSYRWVLNPRTWVEPGWQRYADRSTGPMLTVSRWWGDVGVHLTYRKGGIRQFAGLELSIPLTPALSPVAGKIQASGAPLWRSGLRTRITDQYTRANLVEPRAVPEYSPAWNLEQRVLSGGRLGPGYTLANIARMRDAHGRYGVVD